MLKLKLESHCNISVTNLMTWKNKTKINMKRYLNYRKERKVLKVKTILLEQNSRKNCLLFHGI